MNGESYIVRTVETMIKPQPRHFVGDGFYVSQYFPEGKVLFERFSPFILMDYNAPHYFSPSDTPLGVGAHPHRGFETVTINYSGVLQHHDNKGNQGILNPGEVQWMTAGSGVLHKEYHEKNFAKKGGVLHMVQLWVNLPKKNKMTTPKYQALAKESLPYVSIPQGQVQVIAGQFKNIKGPASTFSPMNIYHLQLNKGEEITINEPATFNTGFLVVNGQVSINHQESANEGDFVLINNDDDTFTLTATSDVFILMLSGQPLNEPVVAHGPFVMNTREELLQAFQDFNNGIFGPLDF